MTENQRPGVYSRYDITSGHSAPRSAAYAGLAVRGAAALSGTLHRLTSYEQALEAVDSLPENRVLLDCVRLLLQSGVTAVLVSAVDGDYAEALSLLEGEDNIGIVVCDAEEPADLRLARDSALASAGVLRERVAFLGLADPEKALTAAADLNSERVVLCCPAASLAGGERESAVYTACALAGKVLAGNDPGWNWSGEAFPLLGEVARLEEEAVQRLIAGGVTAFEPCGGAVECIRPVTTRTKTNGETDLALRSLNTILIIDDVMKAVRAALKARLRGLRLSAGSAESIRSQVAVELAAKQDEGLIERFDAPVVYSHGADPSVCVVELSFGVAHVVSQIHITAHIQV